MGAWVFTPVQVPDQNSESLQVEHGNTLPELLADQFRLGSLGLNALMAPVFLEEGVMLSAVATALLMGAIESARRVARAGSISSRNL
jgi:hypothetical protein